MRRAEAVVDPAEQGGGALGNPDILYKEALWRRNVVYGESPRRGCVNHRTIVEEMVASRQEKSRLLSSS